MKTIDDEITRIKNLMESISGITMTSLPKGGEFPDMEALKNVEWDQLILEPQQEESPVKIKIDVPWESKLSDNIAFYVILTRHDLYQTDISISNTIAGIGLGTKIYRAMVMNFGHLYSGNGRRQNNQQIPKILDRLSTYPEIERYENETGILLVYSGLRGKEELIKRFNGE